jgi:outer membrane lipoprotein carrier protein
MSAYPRVRGRWAALIAKACVVIIACAVPAHSAMSAQMSGGMPAPASNTALDRFLADLRSWETDFRQRITDARGREQAPLTGRLWVQRPGRFRWELGSPQPQQVMVADGLNLWFYDRDLEQVTVRRASESLTMTPASLLAGTVPLEEGFSLVELPRQSGLEWVGVTPKSGDAEFREARLGFSGGALRRMELLDKLGQKVVLEFSGSRRNAPLAPDILRFVVPDGADLIGTPIAP